MDSQPQWITFLASIMEDQVFNSIWTNTKDPKMGDGQVQTLTVNVKKLWDLWNLRICLMLSLFLQVILLFIASMRKRYKSNLLHLFIWSAFFLAEWIAAYTLGQIVRGHGDDLQDPNKSGELYLFWAQFLLLHLAGPDSITCFSPGDNGLWLKQLFGLLCQVVGTIYSFYLLALVKNNKLWIPTILLFSVALIKCYERVKALVSASFDSFGEFLLPEPIPGLDYEELMVAEPTAPSNMAVLRQRLVQYIMAMLMAKSVRVFSQPRPSVQFNGRIRTKVDELKLLRDANSFFENFKVLFTDSFLSFENRNQSREYFLRCHYSDAFRLIEYELSFFYDLMHTKLAVLHNKLGYICRFICFSCVLAAYILFFKVEKEGLYEKFDVYLTHALLIGTIFLDITSLTKIIFSEWSVIRLPRIRHLIPEWIFKRRRWSRSVFQNNMLDHCLYKRSTQRLYYLADNIFGSTGFVDKMRLWLSSSEQVTEELEEFIFNELKMKSEHRDKLEQAMKACQDRGLYALLQSSSRSLKLIWSIEQFHYSESLLLWHLATELCYHNLRPALVNDESRNQKIKYCKLLSNYMFYLLVMQPTMLSPELKNWSLIFQATRAEAMSFFKKRSISDRIKACQALISLQTSFQVRQDAVMIFKRKSIFFDACILTKQLQEMEDQWEVMSRVWVALMSFAAISCSPTIHAQQPSRGGELLTFTWLLIYHLGLGTQFSQPL